MTENERPTPRFPNDHPLLTKSPVLLALEGVWYMKWRILALIGCIVFLLAAPIANLLGPSLVALELTTNALIAGDYGAAALTIAQAFLAFCVVSILYLLLLSIDIRMLHHALAQTPLHANPVEFSRFFRFAIYVLVLEIFGITPFPTLDFSEIDIFGVAVYLSIGTIFAALLDPQGDASISAAVKRRPSRRLIINYALICATSIGLDLATKHSADFEYALEIGSSHLELDTIVTIHSAILYFFLLYILYFSFAAEYVRHERAAIVGKPVA